MAKQVKLKKGQTFTFDAPKGAAQSKHPWDEWFNGELLMIEQSAGEKDGNGQVVNVTEKKDFEISMNQMPNRLKQAARRRYKIVEINRYDFDRNRLKDALIIQARDMNEDERAAEDLLRAEEVEKKKARKAAKAGGNGAKHDDEGDDENE